MRTTPEVDHTPYRLAVAREIRVAMARRNTSAAKLCDSALSMSRATFSAKMNGHRPFDVDDLEEIAAALDISVADLVTPRYLSNLPLGNLPGKVAA